MAWHAFLDGWVWYKIADSLSFSTMTSKVACELAPKVLLDAVVSRQLLRGAITTARAAAVAEAVACGPEANQAGAFYKLLWQLPA